MIDNPTNAKLCTYIHPLQCEVKTPDAITMSSDYSGDWRDAAIEGSNAYYGMRTLQQQRRKTKSRAARKHANKANKRNRT
jgi:hypothetical protein